MFQVAVTKLDFATSTENLTVQTVTQVDCITRETQTENLYPETETQITENQPENK
jgi:hypothetical protein